MKNIILILIASILLWSCDSDGPDQEFSLKGVLVENYQTMKPLAGESFELVCRDWEGRKSKSDVVIPFKTNPDGSFFVKGEPNRRNYFVTRGYNQISSGVRFIEGMGPKHYDLGKITSFKEGNKYPLIIKYDVSASTLFLEGDTLKANNDYFVYKVLDKISIRDFSKPDTVLITNLGPRTHFPDPLHLQELIKDGYNDGTSNTTYLGFIHKRDGTKIEVYKSFPVVFSCDKYPVVTVKIP
jgi:hypothetical protein